MKTPKKRRYRKLLDENSRRILDHLLKSSGFGFSYQVIAAMAFQKPINRVTEREVSSATQYFLRHGGKVTDWRMARTTKARNFIESKSRPPKRRQRRLRVHRAA